MSTHTRRHFLTLPIAMAATTAVGPGAGGVQINALPSWNEGPSRNSILDFVARTTSPGSPDFVSPEARIAVFDNDGTLWVEQPDYAQAAFVFDRIQAMAPEHPEWRHQQLFAAVLSGDPRALAAIGESDIVTLMAATHAGMTTDAFARIVTDWIGTAKHTRFGRPYTALTYQPMLELLEYLRAHGFRTWIVSGGGIEFIRPCSERAYGIPPERVIGSNIKTRFQMADGKPVLMRLPEIDFINDGPGKPVGINRFIGRQPVFAAGNSDGDLEMLQWTTRAPGPGFGLLIHHTDGAREYAYDRQSQVGRLDKALAAASEAGWTVVDISADWRRVFSFE